MADALAIGCVLLFAFFAASFVARNTDLWLHLATGRMIAHGDYRFGVDPFAYTTAGRYWANHAWGFDLGLYLLFANFGGSVVVALKALAIAMTVGVMFYTARTRGPVWLTAGVLLLAVTAMSPRLLLQPTIASFLLLAVCVACLGSGGRALRAVPLLVVLWVNLDGWFLLGPLVVVLFAIGRRLNPVIRGESPWPRWLIPATFAACLLSPHHIWALTLPMELSPSVWISGFTNDPRFAAVFASPWHLSQLGAAGGYNLAAYAFFALLVLCVFSFLVNMTAVLSERGLLCLVFAALAMWQARLIPFFAVVAGPITAMNLGEVVSRTRFVRLGRASTLFAGASLCVLGWFGFVNGAYSRDRGVAWGVHTDPTLQQIAESVSEWRQANHVPVESHVFTSHPDIGHYLAWFAPGKRSSIDSRLPLFTENAAEFAALSRAIGVLPHESSDRDRLDERLAEKGIAGIVIYDVDARRRTDALRGVLHCWDVVQVAGGGVLVVPKGSAFAKPRFDPERAVFASAGGTIPTLGPATLAEPPQWWTLARSLGRRGSAEADSATIYLRLFEDVQDRSPALPLLAMRNARRGTEIDPNDPLAWMMVGRSALFLDVRSWERDAGDSLTPLAFLRHVQTVSGLVQAVSLSPDSDQAHEALAQVFFRRQFFDLAHRHATEYLRLVKRAGRGAGESADAFAERLARASEFAKLPEAMVQDGENRFLIRTTGLAGDPLARAMIATELGLPQKAIDVLLQSKPDLYGMEGVAMLADLLIQTGQLPEARVLLDRDEVRDNAGRLGLFTLPGKPHPGGHAWGYQFPAYDWFDFCQSAGAGNYAKATAALDRLRGWLEREEQAVIPGYTQLLARQVGIETGLATPPIHVLVRLLASRERDRFAGMLGHSRFLSVARGDLTVLGGVLELERGNSSAAAGRFREALGLYSTARGMVPSLPGEPLAKRYLEAIDRAR